MKERQKNTENMAKNEEKMAQLLQLITTLQSKIDEMKEKSEPDGLKILQNLKLHVSTSLGKWSKENPTEIAGHPTAEELFNSFTACLGERDALSNILKRRVQENIARQKTDWIKNTVKRFRREHDLLKQKMGRSEEETKKMTELAEGISMYEKTN